jgi:S-adenosylmethionine-diacylglycerol 3-amino-3-carboxypropyl transferase
VFRRAYDDAFFRHVENPSFARHFHALAERTLTRLPIADNYFVHQMLTGRYPVEEPDGVPPYLAEASGPMLAARAHAFTLVDGSFTDYLCSAGPASIHGFALSNICEWLTAAGIDALFAQILRTAAPGARICIRNFVGWTEIPELARRRLVVDEELSAHLSIRDRSAVQRRILVARVPGGDA